MGRLLMLMAAVLLPFGATALAQTSAVLFQVDMSVQEETGAFDPGAGDIVVVRGGVAPLEWSGVAHEAVESVLDPGVYEVVVEFENALADTMVEFKYVMVTTEDVWESRGNRSFEFTGVPLVLDVVFFDDNIGYTSQDVTVTFTVNENDDCNSCTIDEMAVRGGIAPLDWGNDDNALTDNGDGTWSISLLFPAGTTPLGPIAYKYRAHADMKPERFDVLGDPCSAWDEPTGWMWQDLRRLYGEDCYANNSFDMVDDNPTLELDISDWYPDVVGIKDDQPGLPTPARVALLQNAPNPFNPRTVITFELTESSPVELSVYDLAGHKVATLAKGVYQAGRHTVGWQANDLASGVYLYRLQAEGEVVGRTMLLLK